MNINFSGHELFLHNSGAVYWPEQRLLIIADAHLEKGSWFARRGFHLPPYDSQITLSKILKIYEELSAQRILILGDFFHDGKAHQRLCSESVDLFKKLQCLPLIWIRGNHDVDYVPLEIEAHNEFKIGNIVFRHEATDSQESEISGHFHPKSEFIYKGKIFRERCFIEDGNKLVLPAFGTYTGGLSVKDKVFQRLFPAGCKKYVIINDSVIPQPL